MIKLPTVKFKVPKSFFAKLLREVKTMQKKMLSNGRNAGDQAGRFMRTTGAGYVKQRKALPATIVGKAFALVRPKPRATTLRWELKITDKPTPLAAYPHTQLKRGGVRVRVNKGAPQLLPGASVVMTKRGGEAIVLHHAGEEKAVSLFSSRVTDVMNDANVITRLQELGRLKILSAMRSKAEGLVK